MFNLPNFAIFDTETIIHTNNYDNVKTILSNPKQYEDLLNKLTMTISCYTYTDDGKTATFKKYALGNIIDDLLQYDLVYFHNLDFDGNYLLKILMNFNYTNTDIYPKTKKGKFYNVNQQGSKIYSITIYDNDKKVDIYDSYKILRFSVAILGQYQQDITKLHIKDDNYHAKYIYDWYFHNIDTPEIEQYIQYAKNDVLVVYNALIRFNNMLSENKLNEPTLWKFKPSKKEKNIYPLFRFKTLTGFALSLFFLYNETSTNYLKDIPAWTIKLVQLSMKDWRYRLMTINEFYMFFRTLYNGGYCDYNADKVLTFQKDVFSLDLNSAYPDILLNHPLALSFDYATLYHNLDEEDKKEFMTYLKSNFPKTTLDEVLTYHSALNKLTNLNLIRITDTTISNDKRFKFIFRNNFVYSYESNNETHLSTLTKDSVIWMYDEEYAYFKQAYSGKYEIENTFSIYGKKVDNEYVKLFYNLKNAYKKTNLLYYNLAKLLMNSVTGKFGQKAFYDNEVLYPKKIYEYANEWWTDIVDVTYENKQRICQTNKIKVRKSLDKSFPHHKVYYNDISQITHYNNFLAVSYITSLVRIKIYSAINYFKIDNWVYSDTDSLKIISNDYTLKHMKDFEWYDEDKLGYFKNEGNSKEFIVFHSKAYCAKKDEIWHYTFGGCNINKIIDNPSLLLQKGYVKNGKRMKLQVRGGILLYDDTYTITFPNERH